MVGDLCLSPATSDGTYGGPVMVDGDASSLHAGYQRPAMHRPRRVAGDARRACRRRLQSGRAGCPQRRHRVRRPHHGGRDAGRLQRRAITGKVAPAPRHRLVPLLMDSWRRLMEAIRVPRPPGSAAHSPNRWLMDDDRPHAARPTPGADRGATAKCEHSAFSTARCWSPTTPTTTTPIDVQAPSW